VLTGSTNFSVTGIYVNSNHVLVFDDPKVAKQYSDVFNRAWAQDVNGAAFKKSAEAAQPFSFGGTKQVPRMEVRYSPHNETVATAGLQEIADRITKESKTKNGTVLFAVMDIGTGTGPVFPTLKKIHANVDIFSYGITDTTDGIALYRPASTQGVLVTGKPAKAVLPPPFDQVPGVGLGHQVHHKFVVCGFKSPDAVVYCGSSNLALMGEQVNGDNLIAVHDTDVATVFAIEALALVDHFEFLDRVADAAKTSGQVPKATSKAKSVAKTKSASKQHQAAAAGWFLGTTDKWAVPYYDPKDLHCVDRQLFG
jgi:phosphatidylserine/phosphatidylglycerophosphate/cardiolipin synthase-like enzyme